MTIHLYCMCKNEEKIIPFFLRHYLPLVDRIHVFDNGSTDMSLRLLSGDERISVETVETTGSSFEAVYRPLMDNAWKRSRGSAEWIVTAEMDEHFHHPHWRDYLDHCRATGVTVLRAIGFDMVADRFPEAPAPLWEQITHGARTTVYDKPAIFDPDAVVEINFDYGRHSAKPVGRIGYEPHRQIRLLHYKSLGLEYVCERNRILRGGLRQDDIAAGRGAHYLRSEEATRLDFQTIRAQARRVPGLRAEKDERLELTLADELALVRASPLFDPPRYLRTNPDVDSAGVDPVEHFCVFGWRENRRPNPLFDPDWYRRTYLGAAFEHLNPLLHFMLVGERNGCRPSLPFDPELYRLSEGVPPGESALAHALARLSGGL